MDVEIITQKIADALTSDEGCWTVETRGVDHALMIPEWMVQMSEERAEFLGTGCMEKGVEFIPV